MLADNIKNIGIIKDRVAGAGAYTELIILSGSHMYGFDSIDSDLDYRGFFTMSTDRMLGIKSFSSHLHIGDKEGLDAELYESRKLIGLLMTMNCNTLEHMFATPLYQTINAIELRDIISDMLCKKGLYESYGGMARDNYRLFIKTGRKKTVKKYLYVFRACLAGVHALETGRIEANIDKLLDKYPDPVVTSLVMQKRLGKEDDTLFNDRGLDEKVEEYESWLANSYKSSNLPEELTRQDYERLDKWLKKVRKNYYEAMRE